MTATRAYPDSADAHPPETLNAAGRGVSLIAHQDTGEDLLDAQIADLADRLVEIVRERGLLTQIEGSTEAHPFHENAAYRAKMMLAAAVGLIGGAEINPECGTRDAVLKRTLSERQAFWANHVTSQALKEFYYTLYPHNGEGRDLRILVSGSGGIGDVLYLTPIVRGLAARFPGCMIVVQHEHPIVRDVLASNPYVDFIDSLPHDKWLRLRSLLLSVDVFDMVLEVRYAVVALAGPLTRVPASYFLENQSRSRDWLQYVWANWPLQNNELGRKAKQHGFKYLDLAGFTSLLPIERSATLQFTLECSASAVLRRFKLPATYMTIHHGCDPKMADARGRSTKTLPVSVWNQVVSGFSHLNISVVQLGAANEERVDGVALHLLGKTTLHETAAILKGAVCHIDTEGGLVHLARAMGKRSVVVFGPTNVFFFGYEENVNLAPVVCGDCWWSTREWATVCPLGAIVPVCMDAQSAERITESAMRLAGEHSEGITIEKFERLGPLGSDLTSIVATGRDWFGAALNREGQRVCLVAHELLTSKLVEQVLTALPRASVYALLPPGFCFVPGKRDPRIIYSNAYSVPKLDQSVQLLWALLQCRGTDLEASGLPEALRLLAPGGIGYILIETTGDSWQKELEACLTAAGVTDITSFRKATAVVSADGPGVLELKVGRAGPSPPTVKVL